MATSGSKGFAYTVAECERLLKAADEAAFALLEKSFLADERKGVQQALERARRRLAVEAAERDRVAALYQREAELMAHHGASVALGLDEVGRGAIAGPLAVGGVVLDPKRPIAGINDSKQLRPAERERLAEAIEREARGWAVCYVSAPTVDRIGMAAALRRAFRRMIDLFERRGFAIDLILLDGNPLHLDDREVNLVGGDGRYASIAAASIVAKVHRDRLMMKFDRLYPAYGWRHSKGYGSEEHREALATWGLSPIHRRSFCTRQCQPSLFDEAPIQSAEDVETLGL